MFVTVKLYSPAKTPSKLNWKLPLFGFGQIATSPSIPASIKPLTINAVAEAVQALSSVTVTV